MRDIGESWRSLAGVVVIALALACVPLGSAGAEKTIPGVTESHGNGAVDTDSVVAAYDFLDLMMDRYATGATPRLVQSFTGGLLGEEDFTDSETYDDALMSRPIWPRGRLTDWLGLR